jgi:N-acetylglucosamine-6-phosphate deacetylase
VSELVVTGRMVLDDQVVEGWVEVLGDRISGVGVGSPAPAAARVDAGNAWILPGLVDIHAHGGGGWSVEGGVDDARQAAAFHRSRGTTSLVASLVSGTRAHLLSTVTTLAPLVHDGTLAGLHLEGPYLAPSRRGAHDKDALRAPDPAEVADLLAAGAGAVRMMTLAPELPGALELVGMLVQCGVVAAIGHTDATAEQCRAAVDRGASVATHLFNGMPPLHHRAGGPIAALAADPRVRCEVLHDGHHVEDSVLRLAHHLLAPDRLLLVSDAASATGCADGPQLLGSLPVVLSEGAVRPADGRSLAGSAQPLVEQLARAVRVGLDPVRAVTAATSIPARTLGLTGVGRLAVGARADLLLVDPDWRPVEVMAAGIWL